MAGSSVRGGMGMQMAASVPAKKNAEYEVTPLSIPLKFFIKIAKLEYICNYEESSVHFESYFGNR